MNRQRWDYKPDTPRRPWAGPPLIILGCALVAVLVGGYLLIGTALRAPTGLPERYTGQVIPLAPGPEKGAGGVAESPSSSVQQSQSQTPAPASSTANAVAPGAHARSLIAELRSQGAKADLDRAFDEAERLRSAGAGSDAHLLYYFAAREGHVAAATVLGTLYDPSRPAEAQGVVEHRDAEQAYKWYTRASTGGNATAVKHLEELRAWIEQQVAAGNPAAERLALQWR